MRNYHVIMQIAYALWQVFATGVLSRLSDGRRKMTQVAWNEGCWKALYDGWRIRRRHTRLHPFHPCSS